MLRLTPGILVLFLLPGCDPATESKPKESVPESSPVESQPISSDADGDGVTENDGDCDDSNAEMYPGKIEDCDGIDNNCNGFIDEGMTDTDSDGTADCIDAETCDGVDNDGDGVIDEDFADGDGDGVADCAGTEICDGLDNDADGQVDEGYDADSDTFTACGDNDTPPDCNDSDPTINPDATELADDGVDNDCDGMIDEGRWAAGDIAITEIMNNPEDVGDPLGEYFEIYNTTTRRLSINGLTIASGTELHQITSGALITIQPGSFLVLGINSDIGTNGLVVVDYAYSDISLSNESDDLSIWAGTVLLDEVMWDNGVTMPDGSGASMITDAGFYDSTLNDDGNAWCLASTRWDRNTDLGSPGDDNGLCATTDHDLDGFNAAEGDCNDTDPTIYPGAFEVDPAVDNDCDGVVEWGPVALPVVSATSSLESCNSLYLDGSASYDPDGSPLTYAWSLVAAPGRSNKTSADIINPTSVTPEFRPDVPGTYTFSLTVNDGGTNSLPASVDATISLRGNNNAPTAVASADQSYDESVTCTSYSYGARYTCAACADYDFTIDASASSDPDGDDLSYSFALLSGSYATITSTSGSQATVRFTGAPATYGSTLTDHTTVEVTVTDCMGDVSVDTVELNFTCTGQ